MAVQVAASDAIRHHVAAARVPVSCNAAALASASGYLHVSDNSTTSCCKIAHMGCLPSSIVCASAKSALALSSW